MNKKVDARIIDEKRSDKKLSGSAPARSIANRN
jgi:hypothetical protein